MRTTTLAVLGMAAIAAVTRISMNTVKSANAWTVPKSPRATIVSKQRRKHVAQQITSATSTATTPTTMQVATGTRVTAVVSKTTTNFAKIASAVTAHTSGRVISALNLSKKVAGLQIGRVTATAMTTTTTQGVIGMGVIAAAPKILLTAKIASAGTARMYLRATHASKISRKHAAPRNSKATATATTATIMVVVLGTVVTAAEPRPTSNIAKSANARIVPRKKAKSCPGKAKGCSLPKYKGDENCDDENNNCRCNWDGGDCCSKTVGGTVNKKYCKACKCLDPDNQSDANCQGFCKFANYKGDGNCDDENNNCGCDYDGGDCCAKSLKKPVNKKYCKQCKCLDPKNGGKSDPNCKGVVVRRTTKAMATATTKTTTAVASTTAAIAARNHSRSLLLRNTANNASAWIPKTEAKTMAATKTNVTRAKTNAVRQSTKAMATVTTKTTTVVAISTAVIAAR